MSRTAQPAQAPGLLPETETETETETVIDKLFSILDTDESGTVTFDEIQTAMVPIGEGKFRKAFNLVREENFRSTKSQKFFDCDVDDDEGRKAKELTITKEQLGDMLFGMDPPTTSSRFMFLNLLWVSVVYFSGRPFYLDFDPQLTSEYLVHQKIVLARPL